MTARRLSLLAGEAVREALHLRLPWALALACLGLGAGGAALTGFNFGLAEPRFLSDLADGELALFGGAQALLLTVVLVHGALERGRPQLLLARGVRRWEWLAGNLAAAWAASAALAAGVYLVLGALLLWRGHAVDPAGLAADGARAFFRLAVVAALALATAAICRSTFLAAVLALALTVAGQLAPVAHWNATHGGPAGRTGWTALGCILPDFSLLGDGSTLAAAAGRASVYCALYGLLAAAVFARRDL